MEKLSVFFYLFSGTDRRMVEVRLKHNVVAASSTTLYGFYFNIASLANFSMSILVPAVSKCTLAFLLDSMAVLE